ncbi:YjbF family lipoprotein [Rheinheimera hassiensis]|uniref:YjbF family lipoprotein n=1 Tax=Rheinheimera hassiensis TaxID=1193627 RepID=UPI001F0670B4|nr:YjbF family lipoprotein [Rheinheimera hassiensis]
MITLIKMVFSGLMLLTLTACAGTYHSYMDTLKLAFADIPNAELSVAEVQQSQYDLLYVKHGDRAQAVMVLMHLEAGQHKWISADNAMLIMEHGRLVRTLGLENDLLHLTNTINDPVRRRVSIRSDATWLRLADWHNGEYGYALRSRFEIIPAQHLTVFQQQMNTTLIVEHVKYEDSANYLRFDDNWQNYFWFDSESGTLIKSEQTLSPFSQPITMTYVSRIGRLLPQLSTTNTGGSQ